MGLAVRSDALTLRMSLFLGFSLLLRTHGVTTCDCSRKLIMKVALRAGSYLAGEVTWEARWKALTRQIPTYGMCHLNYSTLPSKLQRTTFKIRTNPIGILGRLVNERFHHIHWKAYYFHFHFIFNFSFTFSTNMGYNFRGFAVIK